jgi:exodeoxyribonuclease VII large subunit
MDRQRSVYTPSELNHEARLHLEAGFGRIWIEGEISNLSRPASGHLYFSLKDARAQVRCAFFRSQAAATPFRPDNGMQVQAHGRLSLYEARGEYQLIVERMEPAGEGRLRAAFEALKKKLQAEGLFEDAHKRPLPAYPGRIAVVTSPSGAVIRDILNVLKRRWPLAAVRIYPVPVQGDTAAKAIKDALAAVDRHGWGDAVIIARGGGSLEDLQAFNEESVARAIAQSTTPVVSAVGHETDFSIADFVADVRAPTPSAAAELLTPDGEALRRAFEQATLQLQRRMANRMQQLAQRHDHLAHRLSRQHPGHKLGEHRKLLAQLRSRLANTGRHLVPGRRSQVTRLSDQLRVQAGLVVPARRARLQELARTLNAVSPLPTLERGYAIVSSESGAIESVSGTRPGQAISAQFADGRVYASVDRVTEERLTGGDKPARP